MTDFQIVTETLVRFVEPREDYENAVAALLRIQERLDQHEQLGALLDQFLDATARSIAMSTPEADGPVFLPLPTQSLP